MKQQEFIDRVIGKPWVDRASSLDSMDCWGCVVLYYKHVLGIQLPEINGYEEGECDTAQGWQSGVHQWERVKRAVGHGLVFTCYRGNKPSHVGITISTTKVLHSRGSVNNPGKVEIHSIRAIESIYGKMTYHKFVG